MKPYTRNEVEAIMCLWEHWDGIHARALGIDGVKDEALYEKHRELLEFWQQNGAWAVRHCAIAAGVWLEEVYNRYTRDHDVPADEVRELLGCFDWEIVPLIADTIAFTGVAKFLPSDETVFKVLDDALNLARAKAFCRED